MGRTDAELTVSIYVPGATMTRSETGSVNPLSEELKITSLQIWAFFSESGSLIAYNKFDGSIEGFENNGLPNGTVTRFGLPLTPEMFALLTTSPRPKVDVYAVANAASALEEVPGENTSRDALDQLVITKIGGAWPLTKAVPEAGLPMSGVLKETDVTGDYPVLNVTSLNWLKLTRAVSKIRFVFCQQGIPATETTPTVIGNDQCKIMGIKFDGTEDGKDCQIGNSERLFTTDAFDLGDSPAYVPLNAYISDPSGGALIPNDKLSILVEPEELFFRSEGNQTESAQHYETRLDAAISKDSQVGPIYFRETDKTISGKIIYRIGSDGHDLEAPFSMMGGDVFSRNHTWIVYACFVEETMKLRLNVVVLPWEWEDYVLDYTTSSVNVIRRFTVFDTPVPTFYKASSDGFFDVHFWHTVNIDGVDVTNAIEGEIIIATPVGGKIYAKAVPGPGPITDAIEVSPPSAIIYPNYTDMATGRVEDCRIRFTITCNKDGYSDDDLKGLYIDLHFCVETPIDHQFVDLGSESIDYYRFILDPDWKDKLPHD